MATVANSEALPEHTLRKLEQLDRDEAAAIPHDHEWAAEVEHPNLTEAFWRDPEPGNTAVLTADQIRFCHYKVGRMIRPFQDVHLNAASYDLTLGPRCLIDGVEEILSPRNPILRIPPGSIALATSREMLLIPHWLVATFNLKSKYIFKGLLMGIGPQIDPGFRGILTCPLHNISCDPIDLHFCKPFAKLDFIKTTWGTSLESADTIGDEEELYRLEEEGKLTSNGMRMKLWPQVDNFRAPLSSGRRAAGVKGSLRSHDETIKGFSRKLNFGGFSVAVAGVAILSAMVGLFAFALIYTNGRVDDARDDAVRAARSEAKSVIRSQGYAEPVLKTRAGE